MVVESARSGLRASNPGFPDIAYLRTLLIHGARSVLLSSKAPPQWALRVAGCRPLNVAVVALANKIARTLWALLAHGRVYRHDFAGSPA